MVRRRVRKARLPLADVYAVLDAAVAILTDKPVVFTDPRDRRFVGQLLMSVGNRLFDKSREQNESAYLARMAAWMMDHEGLGRKAALLDVSRVHGSDAIDSRRLARIARAFDRLQHKPKRKRKATNRR